MYTAKEIEIGHNKANLKKSELNIIVKPLEVRIEVRPLWCRLFCSSEQPAPQQSPCHPICFTINKHLVFLTKIDITTIYLHFQKQEYISSQSNIHLHSYLLYYDVFVAMMMWGIWNAFCPKVSSYITVGRMQKKWYLWKSSGKIFKGFLIKTWFCFMVNFYFFTSIN